MKFFLSFFSLRNDSNDLCKQYFCENFTEEVVVKTITTIMNFPSKKKIVITCIFGFSEMR